MKKYDKDNIEEVVPLVQNGSIVIFPTETSYGLGCNATNQDSVNKIFKIKDRSTDKPLLIIVQNIDEAKKYIKWNDLLNTLSEKYWPGALTIVGEYIGSNLAKGVVSKDNTIAIRVTNNMWLIKFIKKCNIPLVATSANLAGDDDIYDNNEVINQYFKRKCTPDIVVDAGILPKNAPTTVLSVVGGVLKVLRQGIIKL